MLAPEEYMPGWAQSVLACLFGAGGVKLLSVILENRRLTKREFRETLLRRIEALEEDINQMYKRFAEQSAEIARLEAENAFLKNTLASGSKTHSQTT